MKLSGPILASALLLPSIPSSAAEGAASADEIAKELANPNTPLASPILSYNWDSGEWTIPLNLSFGKTVMWGDTPWKISAEINYYIERPDAFGPEWMVGINFAPVVENVLAGWFR